MSQFKPKILYLTHQYSNKGGVEEHLKSLETELADRYEVSIIYPEAEHLRLKQTGKDLFQLPAQKKSGLDPIRASQTEISLDLALQIVRPDLIQIVHLFNWPASAALLCLQFGVPVVASFHDYFLLTPDFTMQQASSTSELITKEYSERIFKADISEFLAARRDFLKSVVNNFSARVVPSTYLEKLLSEVFPNNFIKIEYGIEDFITEQESQTRIPRFGFLGRFLPQKGLEILLEAFSKIRQIHPEVELYMYGGDLDQTIPGIKSFGQYDRSDLGKIVSNFNVGIIPSIFAETYCMTASELWHGNRPFIASKIGALADRVEHKHNGFLVKPNSVEELAKAMEWFIENNEWKNWSLPNPPLVKQMAENYDRLYQEVLNAS